METYEIAPPSVLDVHDLRAQVTSPVWRPGDEGYDRAVSTWNAGVQLRPAAVLSARTAADVVAAVGWAALRKVPVGAHATGHGAVANADGALLINTSQLNTVAVDAQARTATVGAGKRMAALTAAVAPHGLATLQGSSGSVSVAGFVSGGGLAVLSRTYGLAADHVRSIDIVTADGTLHTVTADHQPDLFWALRGGKGNFGVITALSLSLVPLTSFYGGGIFFDGAHASAVLHAYQRWIASHTERTSSSVALLRLPPDPDIPDALRGRFVVHVRMAHIGDHDEGARLAADIRGAAPVLLDMTAKMPVTAMDAVHQDPPGPMPTYEQGCLLDELTPDTIEAILARTAAMPDSPLILVEIRHLGGAIARRPDVPSAVPGRDAAFSLFTIAPDVPPLVQAGPAAVAGLFAAVRPWRSASALPNFLGRCTDPGLVAAAWSAGDRARLLAIKRRWDPENLFRLGHALLAPR
jgi:FAD binding domain/Berberine and berberine like